MQDGPFDNGPSRCCEAHNLLPADFSQIADAVVMKAEAEPPIAPDGIALDAEPDTRPRAVRRREARRGR